MDRSRPKAEREWLTTGPDAATFEALVSRQPPSRVWSLLLEVMARRASQRKPQDLLRQWEADSFTRPSAVDQRAALAIDAALFEAAESFEAVELSPVAPLGACSVVGRGSQNRVVSALRGTEVVADPTNALALECARRLRERPGEVVRLATSHRCLRAQAAPKGKGFAQHFRLFCLATAGREQKDHAFTVASIVEHVETWRRGLARLEGQGYAFPSPSLKLLAAPAREPLAARVARETRGLPVSEGALEHPYYGGLRFSVYTEATPAGGFPLIDGGVFDWVQQLTANRRLVFVASAMGSQLAAALFRKRSLDPA